MEYPATTGCSFRRTGIQRSEKIGPQRLWATTTLGSVELSSITKMIKRSKCWDGVLGEVDVCWRKQCIDSETESYDHGKLIRDVPRHHRLLSSQSAFIWPEPSTLDTCSLIFWFVRFLGFIWKYMWKGGRVSVCLIFGERESIFSMFSGTACHICSFEIVCILSSVICWYIVIISWTHSCCKRYTRHCLQFVQKFQIVHGFNAKFSKQERRL